MVKKIIFLDFDGPLSNARTTLGYGDTHYMDPVVLRAINHICSVSGAKIVCTSTRALMCREHYHETMWRFEQGGLDTRHIHPDWSCNKDQRDRYKHIDHWLQRHPEVTHYCVVDDEFVKNKEGKIHPFFVKVSMYNGIGVTQFRKIAAFLGFDLTKAFHAAHAEACPPGQLSLPVAHYSERANADILITALTADEKAEGVWQILPSAVLDYRLSEGKIELAIEFAKSKLRGTLYVAARDLRRDVDSRDFYMRPLSHALIVPEV